MQACAAASRAGRGAGEEKEEKEEKMELRLCEKSRGPHLAGGE